MNAAFVSPFQKGRLLRFDRSLSVVLIDVPGKPLVEMDPSRLFRKLATPNTWEEAIVIAKIIAGRYGFQVEEDRAQASHDEYTFRIV